jgi:hypothetical protein
LTIFKDSTEAMEESANGSKLLIDGLQTASRDRKLGLELISDSQTKLENAVNDLDYLEAELENSKTMTAVPAIFRVRVEELTKKIVDFKTLSEQNRKLAALLSKTFLTEGPKNYLVLLQDNTVLRPGGGLITAYSVVKTENGRLISVKAGKIKDLDKLLEEKTQPIKTAQELKINNPTLESSNSEADGQSNFQQISQIYQKASGENLDGVVTLDLKTLADLLKVSGELNLTGLETKINSDTLETKTVLALQKDDLLSGVLNELLPKILTEGNKFMAVSRIFQSGLEEKHLLINATDEEAENLLRLQNWTGSLPEPTKEEIGERREFFAFSESNLQFAPTNFYVQRSLNFTSKLDNLGILSHSLEVSYFNQSPSEIWPAGTYQAQTKIYLPLDNKLDKASWGETDLLKTMERSDAYGWLGYTTAIELKPKEQKSLKLGLQEIKPVELKDNQIKIIYKLFKQPGTNSDKVKIIFNFDPSYKVVTTDGKADQGSVLIESIINKDKTFNIVLQKIS